MKKIITPLLLAFVVNAQAQLAITPNQTALYLANKLVATSGTLGVTVSNATLTCDSNSNGEFTGVSNLGIADGIVLGSGDVMSNSVAGTFGIDGLATETASTYLNAAGDAQLGALISNNTFDACVLEFDLQPVGSFVEFEYVFGSEEYPEFNCSPYNDVFAFFISGPGFSMPTNIALIPSTSTEVSINTINDGSGTCLANTALYVANAGTTSTVDGFTTPLIAHANVTAGATYHLKMAVADVADGILNSYVVLKANSLKSGNTTPTGLPALTKENGLEIYPTVAHDVLTLKNALNSNWEIEVMDITGRLVYRTTLLSTQNMNTIYTSSFNNGVYLLKAKRLSDNQRFSMKFIKE